VARPRHGWDHRVGRWGPVGPSGLDSGRPPSSPPEGSPLPADFLMPLFVLTLLANAVLVAFAVRGMRNGQFDADRPSRGPDRPPTRARSGPEPRDLAVSGSDAVGPVLPDEVGRGLAAPLPSPDLPPTADPAPTLDPAPVADPILIADPAVVSVPPPPTQASTPTRSRRPATDPDSARPANSKRGRRRFSLPNLDDDHEKVNRSIETFLGGADATGGDGSTPPENGVPSTVAGGGATTVVLVAVAGQFAETGTTAFRSTTRTPRRRTVESEAASEALALVERTLRNAARGTDIVTRDGRGRFRIVMASTGELAAHLPPPGPDHDRAGARSRRLAASVGGGDGNRPRRARRGRDSAREGSPVRHARGGRIGGPRCARDGGGRPPGRRTERAAGRGRLTAPRSAPADRFPPRLRAVPHVARARPTTVRRDEHEGKGDCAERDRDVDELLRPQ